MGLITNFAAVWYMIVSVSYNFVTISAYFSCVISVVLLLLCASPFQRLRMMIKPLVLVKAQENGPDQQTENQSQNPANEEAYI